MKRLASSSLLLSLLFLTGCSSDSAAVHDPGKVVQAASKVSVAGHLYATKGRSLYLFSGTRVVHLLKGAEVMDPAVTANGQRLAFARFERQGSVIVVADSTAANGQAITPAWLPEGALWAFDPSFSPDGTSIAYLTDRGKQRSSPRNLQPNDLGVWRYSSASGQSVREVAPVPYTGGDADPVYRPGAPDQLLFTTYLYGGDPLQPVARLTWMSLRTGAQVYLSPDAERNFAPAISPDGRYVAFIHATGSSDDLEVMPLAESYAAEPPTPPSAAAVLLQAGMVSQPIWSPDGSAIAFMMLRKGSFDLFILPVSTAGTVHATGPAQAVTNGSFLDADSRLAWGP